MQQQTASSNLQIKLIGDARKLLEKVRNEQAMSIDSSFDSSFLFDDSVPTTQKEPDAPAPVVAQQQQSSKAKDVVVLPKKPVSRKFSNVPASGLPPRVISKSSTKSSPNRSMRQNSTKSNSVGTRPLKPPTKPPTKKAVTKKEPKEETLHLLIEENDHLRQVNDEMQEEMNDFEYKLYCLEQTLGIIEDVEKTSVSSGADENLNPSLEATEIIKNERNPLGEVVLQSTQGGGDINKLSPVTSMFANAVLEGSGVNTSRSNSPAKLAKEEELIVLRDNNSKMVFAIKALAQATIAQTRKHYLYKKKHYFTKKMIVEESEKAKVLMIQKNEFRSQFLKTRSEFLKEQDIRELLFGEVKHLAKKSNSLRQEREREEDAKKTVLERIECRDDAASVLSRLSESSCYPILKEVIDNTNEKENQILKNGRENFKRCKQMEKVIMKLTGQLKKRDEKIKKLEANLKLSMQYLQGTLGNEDVISSKQQGEGRCEF